MTSAAKRTAGTVKEEIFVPIDKTEFLGKLRIDADLSELVDDVRNVLPPTFRVCLYYWHGSRQKCVRAPSQRYFAALNAVQDLRINGLVAMLNHEPILEVAEPERNGAYRGLNIYLDNSRASLDEFNKRFTDEQRAGLYGVLRPFLER